MLSAGPIPLAKTTSAAVLASTAIRRALAVPAQTSYRKLPAAAPGIIQAENYDRGGNTVAYYDTTLANTGKKYRLKEGVDISVAGDIGGGYAVFATRKGEWIDYTVNVTITGFYDLSLRVASMGSGGSFHVQVDDVRKTPKMTVPNTFGARNWTTVNHNGVFLTQGQHVLRLVMGAGGYKGNIGNFNWIGLTYTGMLAPGNPVILGKSNSHMQLGWQDNSPNEIGFKIERMTALNGVWEQIGVVAADVTNFTDSGLLPNTQYSYRLRATDGLLDSDYSPAAGDTTDPLIVEPTYSEPLVIRQGGTYSGNWQSLSPDVPAISVETSEPVIIENSRIRSAGTLIQTMGAFANLTVRNTSGYALNPNRVDLYPGRFLDAEQFVNVVLENNYMEGTSGIYLYDYRGNGSDSQTVKVVRNKALNIDGRYSDGNGGYQSGPGDHYAVQFFQINGAWNLSGAEVAWNEVINEPGKSRVEDNVSIFSSSGTATSPFQIHNNYIQGAYPADPYNDADYSGGGIMLSDVGASYIRAFGNQIVSTANYGAAISSGHDNAFYDNRIVSSGRFADGQMIPSQNVGAYIWNFDGDSSFVRNEGWGNLIGWMNADGRNDWWVPDASLWANNSNWPGSITTTTEAVEYQIWLQKLANYGVQVSATTVSPAAAEAAYSTIDTYSAPSAPAEQESALSPEGVEFSLFSSQPIVGGDTWLRPIEQIGLAGDDERDKLILGTAVYSLDEWRVA